MRIDSEVVELIYDVPLGRSQWKDVVEAIRIEMQAELGFMVLIKPAQPPLFITTTADNDALFETYHAYYWQIDPWIDLLDQYGKPDLIDFGEKFLPKRTFHKGEYYNDFWRTFGLGETIGGRFVTGSGAVIQIGIPRGNSDQIYTDDDSVLLRIYCAHIRRAIDLEGLVGVSMPEQFYEFTLGSQFGLTTAETKLVLSLFKTNCLKSSSNLLNRSYHTVRSQLKSVYQKTETNSQLQLIAKLTRT